jgi:hypothetical protein
MSTRLQVEQTIPEPLSVKQTQMLCDEICNKLNIKDKYVIVVAPRKRYGWYADVYSWILGQTRFKRIVAAKSELRYRERIIKSILHEITHFKRYKRLRTRYRNGKWNPYAERKRYHTKSFWELFKKLQTALQPHMQYLTNMELSIPENVVSTTKPTRYDKFKRKREHANQKVRQIKRRIKLLHTRLRWWERKLRYFDKQLQQHVDAA